MKNRITELLGVELPIFAFSHCRNVVSEVSKAGGLGVMGTAYFSADLLEQELAWIDSEIGDRSYGVNLLLPGKYKEVDNGHLEYRDLPEEQVSFLKKLLDDAGIPPLPETERDELLTHELAQLHMSPQFADELLEVVLRHKKVKLVVSALGVPPPHIVERLHAAGLKVGAMTGKAAHALRHKAAGLDLVIAQGTEAAGHTGSISSMVLWPEIVDAVSPMPVLAAGGIGRGRQMAAAFALGAQGIWCGSIWLGTVESELEPELKQLLFDAESGDAVQTRARTGKPVRMLRSKLTEAWLAPGAPPTLPMPYQTAVNTEARLRIDRARRKDFMTYPVGQIVGSMKAETSVRQVIYDMLVEFGETVENVASLASDEE